MVLISGERSTAYTYDDNDRLTQQGGTRYSYDDNGNTLTETLDTDITAYGYNARNELISVEQGGVTTGYGYNPNGIRISKTENGFTTRYVVDENRDYAQVLIEDDGTAQVSYTYGDDLISQERGGEAYFYHYDGLGSTRSLTDSQGYLANTYDYEAFGEVLNQTGSIENSYLFAGEQFDPTLDQYYLRARYYDQSQGRFTQQDTWMGNNQDPITLHKYLYANADPISNVDPSGNFSLGQLSASIGISATLNTLAVAIPEGGSPSDYGYAVSLGVIEGAALYGTVLAAIKAGKLLIPIGKSMILARQIERIFKSTSNVGQLIPGFKYLAYTFNLNTKAGTFFIRGSSTASSSANGVAGPLKHLVGEMISKSGNAITTEFAEAMVLTELKAAVELAAGAGIQYGKKIVVKTQGNTWELMFDAPKAAGQFPALYHMQKVL